MTLKNKSLYRLTVTALLLALGLALPFLTGQIQVIGKAISPLHIPVLICGLTCGWPWGLGLGLVLPVLRGLIFTMPPFPNSALPMAFELAAYGLLTGLLYPLFLRLLNKKTHLPAMLCALIGAMIGGRAVGGAAKALLLALGVIGSKAPFTFAAFLTGYFVETAVGAAIHVVLVPAIVLALERAKLSPMFMKEK